MELFVLQNTGILTFYSEKTHWTCGNDIIWTKKIDITHFVSFFFFLHFFLKNIYLILCVNIQLNVLHFYIFFQIAIYRYESLADEIWWTFYKRTNWASRKNIKCGLRVFFSFVVWKWSIVNTDEESTHECNFFAEDPGKL